MMKLNKENVLKVFKLWYSEIDSAEDTIPYTDMKPEEYADYFMELVEKIDKEYNE